MPEWAVSMLMASNEFSRAEATERMRLQEKILVAQFKMDDTLDDSGESF